MWTGCWRRITAAARRSLILCSPNCADKRRWPTTSSRISPHPPALPGGAAASRLSRSVAARSHLSATSRIWWKVPWAWTPPRACKPCGRCVCWPMSAAPIAPHPMTTVAGWQALTAPSAGRMSIKAERRAARSRSMRTAAQRRLSRTGESALPHRNSRRRRRGRGDVQMVARQRQRGEQCERKSFPDRDRTELKLASLGRDAVLRFNTGDWVEILDDWRESQW